METWEFYQKMNRLRFVCQCGSGYATHNRTNFRRHQRGAVCFIFRHSRFLPREICNLISSFIHSCDTASPRL